MENQGMIQLSLSGSRKTLPMEGFCSIGRVYLVVAFAIRAVADARAAAFSEF